MKQFTTHHKTVVTGDELQQALNNVAEAFEANQRAIYKENEYASHVTNKQKLDNLDNGILTAQSIRAGNEHGFWIYQLINTELTGECIALLA